MQIRTHDQIKKMRSAGKVLHKILQQTKEIIVPGINVKEVEAFVDSLFKKYGAIPAFKGYQGFPSSICISVNDQVVHGLPQDRILEAGDIIGLDCGVKLDGWNTDSAITVMVGGKEACDPEVVKLVETTEKALEEAIKVLKDGVLVGEISNTIGNYITQHSFHVIEDLGGHGIGTKVHEDPYIPNEGSSTLGPKLKAGMTIAIEPISGLGTSEIFIDKEDGWTIYTMDGSYSAHFEHTVLITEQGAEILT
ncbi:MAG: type I methionyl aminopeptidase [Candidatus Gracilibacteria bacterium]